MRFAVAATGAAAAGELSVDRGGATGRRRTSTIGYEVVEYPHIQRRHVVRAGDGAGQGRSTSAIAPGLRVGYVMGVGDQVPQAIEQLGAEVI